MISKVAQRAASRHAAEELIVVHTHGDGEMFDVTKTNVVTPVQDYVEITLPGGTISIARSIDAIKANMDMTQGELLEALSTAGLIETDDSGNYIL